MTRDTDFSDCSLFKAEFHSYFKDLFHFMCLPTCMSVYYVCARTDQKEASDRLGPELEIVANHPVGAGKWNLCRLEG